MPTTGLSNRAGVGIQLPSRVTSTFHSSRTSAGLAYMAEVAHATGPAL